MNVNDEINNFIARCPTGRAIKNRAGQIVQTTPADKRISINASLLKAISTFTNNRQLTNGQLDELTELINNFNKILNNG